MFLSVSLILYPFLAPALVRHETDRSEILAILDVINPTGKPVQGTTVDFIKGNFPFTLGYENMMLQSHQGYIEVFPAVPLEWKDIGFNRLKAEGGFLVSAFKEKGITTKILIESVNGGPTRLKLPFRTYIVTVAYGVKVVKEKSAFINLEFSQGSFIEIENGYE